jgi:preprotein translocase subunit SecE
VSEERGKRDETSRDVDETPGDVSTPDASSSDNAAAATDSSGSAARPTGKRATRRTRTASASPVSITKPSASRASVATRDKSREPKKMNIFKRLRKFFREVVAELRKVIWPNRKQMVTYTSVVLVFVTFMVAYISGLDVAFGKGISWLFG